MMTRRLTILAALALVLTVPVNAGQPAMQETPNLADAVAEGTLPPVAERIPREPLIVDPVARGRVPGIHGGRLRTFVSRSKDVRYISVWSYTRLVGYDETYALVPDILRDVEVSNEGRSVTLHLRAGHRWSDGHPFTTEDLRYWWEDVARNAELSPSGPPAQLLVNGEAPTVEVLSETAIRYTWYAPNPQFLPALAMARPVYIYRPAHYMKQFHADYADPEALEDLVEASGRKTWASLHNRMDNLYNLDNPKLPTLQPWINTTKKNSTRYILGRNPYYHRIDTEGRQLPYLDEIEMEIAASSLIAAKATMGEAGLQIRSLGFSDAPVLKRGEDSAGYTTRIWRSGSANEVAIYLNLNYGDPVWRDVFRDVRVRRALSLAISRKAINKVLYYGLAEERAVAALEESPLFDAGNATAWARFDLDEANRLLDEAGLAERNPAGLRLLPDGRPMEMVIETAGERPEEADALELVGATWKQAGVRLLVRPLDRDILRNRAFAGRSMAVSWFGWHVGIPTPVTAPTEVTPVDQQTFSWPKWGQYFQTGGAAGEAPDMEAAIALKDLFDAWVAAVSDDERAGIWRQILAIHADQVFVIGTIARAPMPLVVDAALRNVPDEGIYAWDPGGQLGVHRMDEFFFDEGRRP